MLWKQVFRDNGPKLANCVQLLKAPYSGTEVMALNWINAQLPNESSQEQKPKGGQVTSIFL